VVDGELTHRDSMGNERTLSRGQIQYMSAGTGVLHSEYNHGKDLLRFFQIWIFPDKKGYEPNYGDVRFKLEDRYGKWLALAGPAESGGGGAPVKIHADVHAYAAILSPGKSLDFGVSPDRQAYLALIEGGARLTGGDGGEADLAARDAAEITGENFTVTAGDEAAHLLVIEMARG
jgi:redox-sensitive bicupin YhaK (pirin superfamily)